MVNWIEENKPLPPFRKDLKLYKGPDDADGSPTYNLFDPVRAQYYKVSWGESLILTHFKPGMTPADLLKEIENHTTLKLNFDDVKYFFEDAYRHNLIGYAKTSEHVQAEADRQQQSTFKWLLYNYLYFRVPLIQPDKFLKRTLPYVLPLASKTAFYIYFVLTLIGIYFLMQRFDDFLHTFSYFFSFEGIIVYGLTITLIKVIHEFAHAYTAAYYHIHVPNMGAAFMVLWPVLYTNVTDSWKLAKRSQRLAISIAGIVSELVLAGLSTLGWAITPPGILHSIFFIIASITWITTLLINLNPAMRWDGYYLLSDLWGIDNLQSRAFAMTRWKMRSVILGIQGPPPEEVSPRNEFWMVVYSIYAWVYRLILYTGIALFIYFTFTKTLGIFLFLTEIFIFILWPITSELFSLFKLKSQINLNARLSITTCVIGVLLLWFFLPLPHEQTFPAITVPYNQQIIYVPDDAQIEKIYAARGEAVKAGQPIALLKSNELDTRIKNRQLTIDLLQKEIDILSFEEDKDRAFLPEKQAELARSLSEYDSLKAKKDALDLKSELNGKLYEWDQLLKVDQYVSKDQVLGKIGAAGPVRVFGFVPESLLTSVYVNQPMRFDPQTTLKTYKGIITNINPIGVDNLIYPQLASIYGGELAVTPSKTNQLNLQQTYYLIDSNLDNTEDIHLRYGEVGWIQVKGPWESHFSNLVRYLIGIFIRESGV